MSEQLFYDAMEYVGDDLIESVGKLREQKKSHSIHPWIRWGSMAACLCLIVGGVWIASRYGLLSRPEMEDAAEGVMDQENADGSCLVHTVNSIRVTESGKNVSSITNAPDITEVYDLLNAFYRDESTSAENEAGKSTGEASDQAEVESAGGKAKEYHITLINLDKTEVTYILTGKNLKNTETGESVTLTSNQVKQLKDALNLK